MNFLFEVGNKWQGTSFASHITAPSHSDRLPAPPDTKPVPRGVKPFRAREMQFLSAWNEQSNDLETYTTLTRSSLATYCGSGNKSICGMAVKSQVLASGVRVIEQVTSTYI
jgi:hypothetical protein